MATIEVGETYRDSEGRSFQVDEVDFTATNGREVLGWLRDGGPPQRYSTTFKIFERVWEDKRPPAEIRQ